jgi:hypothetical protein
MINGTRAVFSCSVILAQFPCSPSCHGNSKSEPSLEPESGPAGYWLWWDGLCAASLSKGSAGCMHGKPCMA